MNIFNIILAILGIVVLFVIILELCFSYKAIKKENEMYKKFLDSLKPGRRYTYCFINISDNPFEGDYEEEITILEIKKNKSGETWVKIEYSDGTVGCLAAQELWDLVNVNE